MNKTTKTTLQFMIAVIFFASFVFVGCNNSSEADKKTGTNDTVTVNPGSMEVTPTVDTPKVKDTAAIRPTPTPN